MGSEFDEGRMHAFIALWVSRCLIGDFRKANLTAIISGACKRGKFDPDFWAFQKGQN
jgi:hypothetical protein